MDFTTIEICGDDYRNESERNTEDVPDLRPEYCHYKDDGCELADSCLNCPFPYCLYDEPRGKQRWLKQVRDQEIIRMFKNGSGTKELGIIFGLSRRTIQRALKNATKVSTYQADRRENEIVKRGEPVDE
jgi:hypothetical protein